MLRKFTSIDLLYIAILGALGLAVKPIVTPVIHLVSAPLMIPGGSLAGGFYMMWIAMAIALVNKPGTGCIIGLVQAIVMISLGYFGNHGAVSLLSYTIPGIAAELVSYLYKNKTTIAAQVSICLVANLSGTLIVTLLVMRLATIPLMISLVAGAISGILGGLLSFSLLVKLKQYRIV